ncbi:hypothetical protein [Sporosarcina sp. FSL K6-3457]|uniref:hypothetical protein n=1 Tax=Sporosarcina sp. FSL K6-3457 TaxID=2978204 RepID=UPI0030FCA1DC
MLSIYGVLKENADNELCIDDIPVKEFIAKYKNKEVSISITDTSEIDIEEE